VHPGISDDDGGPTMRVNVLKELLEPSVLAAVRAAPLVSVAALGSFSLRDVAMATGELVAAAGAGGTPPDMAKIDAAFGNCDLAQLQATAASARQALANIQGIERYVADKVGAQHGLDLEPLCGPLKRIDKLLGERLARREPALGSTNGTGGNGADGAHEARAVRGEIASRTDVVRVLDTLCAYYERHEPASPIPLLLRRAQRLVPMSFIEIVRELAPAGVSEIETIRGPQDSEKR
jgi:type VI secretion system protein ImpA